MYLFYFSFIFDYNYLMLYEVKLRNMPAKKEN